MEDEAPKRTRWYGALPQTKIVIGDRVVDFSGGEFDKVVAELRIELESFKPVAKEGHHATAKALGYVVGMRVLTLEEAGSLGIEEQSSPQMIYLQVEEKSPGSLNDTTYSSVGLYPNVKTEDGKTRDYWLDHLSLTHSPQVRLQQPTSDSLEGLFFEAVYTPKLSTETPMPDPKTPTTTPPKTIEEEAVATRSRLAQLETDFAALSKERDGISKERDDLRTALDKAKTDKLEVEAKTETEKLDVDEAAAVQLQALYVRDKPAFLLAASMRDTKAKGDGKDSGINLSSDLSDRKAGRGAGKAPDKAAIAAKAHRIRSADRANGGQMTYADAMAKAKE